MRSFLACFLCLAACSGSNGGTSDLSGSDLGSDAAMQADMGPPIRAEGEVDLNDVTLLLPLPKDETERKKALWLLPPAGSVGPGFPAAFVDQLPDLNGDLPSVYPRVIVVGLRFDDCFKTAQGCQRQIRLVAQPAPNADGSNALDDSALHLFYLLDDAEANKVVTELVALRAASPVSTSGKLRVHPGLAQAGYDSALGAALRALVTSHCRADNLIRVTANTFSMDNWAFSKFDVVGGALSRQQLSHMAESGQTQVWLRQAQRDDVNDPSGVITPAPTEGFTTLLSVNAYGPAGPVDPPAAAQAAQALVRIENPTVHTPETTDCVGCHLATPTRRFAKKHGVSFALSDAYVAPSGIDVGLDFDPRLDGNLGATIQLGYHTSSTLDAGTMPSVSDRVAFESAEVVRRLRGLP